MTHNEGESLLKLLTFIAEHKDKEDEIVILDDYSEDEKTKEILDTMCSIHDITIDLYWVPRVNTVDGLTQEHIDKWRWQVNEKGWVNWPDYQGRIWRNRPNIMWKNKVHEVLTGYKEHTYLPMEEEFCFYHPKDIGRQEKQNEFYSQI